MSEEKEGRLPEEKWNEVIRHRDEFIKAFKEYDEDKINSILQDLPCNKIEGDDDYEPRDIVTWKDCPLRMTAGYYANNEAGVMKFPMCSIEELKALLNE